MRLPRAASSGGGARRAALATIAVLALAGAVWAADPISLEGDPFRGRVLLVEKRCIQCHSVWDHGGELGPEMSTAVARKSWLDLVGSFWNHTPRMIDAVVEGGDSWPILERSEMADLLSYLYYLRLFDEPGDPSRGSVVFTRLRCGTCHKLGGEGGSVGGSLDRFSAYPSPVMLVQAMWNAGPRMHEAQMRRWTSIASFARGELTDVQAHIRAHGVRSNRNIDLLPLPDPARGGRVFREKRCALCHGPRGDAPDLGAASLNKTVAEIGGMLWNHSSAMNEWMRARGVSFPTFKETEMADLIAYLYFLGFVGEQGDPDRGERVFREKGCSSCHESPDGLAPALDTTRVADDPISLSAAMWNHAPEMHALMAEREVAWPAFEEGDMKHLAAYMRQIALGDPSEER